MDKINVFILAAGFGERLHPITNYIPKPLLPVLGKPVLQSVIENISILKINEIGINLYHKKETIEEWISRSPFREKIRLFYEGQILGTGGALKNAEEFLIKGTFLVHNSDILSRIDLKNLLEYHLSSGNLVTLAVHDYPEFNNLIIDEKGFLKVVGTGFKPALVKGQRLAFTGIAIYEPAFLKFLPHGASSVVDGWLKAMATDCKIGTYNATECYWRDIGRPSSYATAVIEALRADGEVVYIHSSIEGCKDIQLNGCVVIEEKSKIGKNISFKNCIILPGGYAGNNSHHENCILGHHLKIQLSESEMLGLSGKNAPLIGTGGSDRKYYRIKKGRDTAVLMECIKDDPEFHRQIEYTRFFLKYGIPVPELIEINPKNTKAIFEDAGDISLYTWLKCPRDKALVEHIYRKVIDILVLMHSEATRHISDCPVLQQRVFDYEYCRWETAYFIERFIVGIKNIRIKNHKKLEKEFHNLALKTDSISKTVIHRDFQSQNIMVKDNMELRIIDYQGARIGPPGYDVASILWDPYYRLEDNMRGRLLDYYISKIKDRFGGRFNEKDFRDSLLPCRLQRHMQALGAYGFLSSVKGKKYFLKYVPEGLRLLKDDLSLLKNEYPELCRLVNQLT